MTRKTGQLVAGAAVLAAVAALAPADQLGLGPVPQVGVLLLRNGEAIHGKISRAGELYCVALPSAGRQGGPTEWAGGEIRIKAADVEFCCRDLQEGYRRKRAAIGPGDVRGHLRLAQWCLRHGLLDPAGRELADALDADPTHPMIDLLHRRLKMAMEPPSVRSAGHENARPTGGPPAVPVDRPPSPEELDRLVRGMPPGAVETFTQTIQPLLINNCAAAGCHGPRSESRFRLLRTPIGRPPSRRLTQRNLHAALAWVDRKNPAASRLLTDPAHPHGTAHKAVFGQGQAAQYQRMVDWVHQLSQPSAPKGPRRNNFANSASGWPGSSGASPRISGTVGSLRSTTATLNCESYSCAVPKGPETVAAKDKPPLHAMPTELPDFDLSALEASVPPGRLPAAGRKFAEQKPPAQGPSVKRGASLPVFVPVDPFDPEIFNRRFFPKEPSGNAGG